MRPQPRAWWTAAPLAGLALAAVAAPQTPAQTAFFESKVRPLLVEKCAVCHTGDAASGGVRLDRALSREQAQQLLAAVKHEGKVKMPPSGKKLDAAAIGALEQWVKDGAPWPAAPSTSSSATSTGIALKPHWSFQKVVRPAVPRTKSPAWVRNPIDAFVLAKLEQKSLKPNPTASRRELIRRLSYDLIGLPPTPEEVVAFEANQDPNAYEKLVDRLLASPHYGEKWGRHWLDLVRFAETNSYERDNPKPNAWRYRDYVIRSFNSDKPYDRFVMEQLAGDELPDGGNEGLIATGFYRLGIWDDEPTNVEQAHYDNLDDLVTTVGQTFLGLTLDCARCHDHKIDPIPQKDYYRFLSFFQGINDFKNGGPTDEKMLFESDRDRDEYAKRVAELEKKRTDKAAEIAKLDGEFTAARDALLKADDIADLKWRYFEGEYAKIPAFDTLTPVATGAAPNFRLDVRKRSSAFGVVFDGFLNVATAGEATFWLDSDDGSRLTIAGKALIDYDGSHGEGHEKVAKVVLPAGRVAIRLDYIQGAGESPLGLNLAWAGPGFARRPLSAASATSALGLPVQLAAYGERLFPKEHRQKRAALAKELEELQKAEAPVAKLLCVTEVGNKSPETFLLKRGNIETKGDAVTPGFPVCAGGGEAKFTAKTATSGRRTALAQWITSPDNPLTARVIVNRIVQGHLGRGLVRTPNDYGYQGARPTHPELLDWLAAEFVESGWSVKKLHKLILTSNTYKQSSKSRPDGLAKDAPNDLFWRVDMRRLSAEEIRDSVLAVCGNLNPAQFGPGVFPEIQKEVLAGQSIPGKDWHTELMKPEDQNRRSIYVFVKRSLLYPLLESFDLAETDRTTPGRFASVQPTQALGMLNSSLMQKQAQVLAERVKKDVGDGPVPFVRRAFTLVTQRAPTEPEIGRCARLMDNLRRRGATEAQAQNGVCLALLNLSEFIYLD